MTFPWLVPGSGSATDAGWEIDGIGVSQPGPRPLVSCAVTYGQPHRQMAMDPCGMLDERGTGVTAIEEDPVRGMSGKWIDLNAQFAYGGSGWPTWR